ncbi:hypothetical protein RND71_008999 [Anisodus tanguticus]|uniref:GRAM domain-containing protein n=1 Tax=Anisodus tanguticus TaxID=243964 RepID=A0AAE1VUP6_9SOLA|nr:hypothetical protein RND71_008999 [Anisodus tanguticus]
MESVKGVLGRWGKKVGEATKKAEDLAGNTWQHYPTILRTLSQTSTSNIFLKGNEQSTYKIYVTCCHQSNKTLLFVSLAQSVKLKVKTGPSLADAALGRIAQGTKVLAEGGYDKIFRQTFETVPEEQLQNSFACYLSTSAGPVMGVLYVSTAKLAFCSDNPLSYKAEDKTEWSYYKDAVLTRRWKHKGFTCCFAAVNSNEVVIPLHQLKAINSSSSRTNPSEKYVQTISVDNHEFWFMGFLNYTGAVNSLQEALQARNLHSA